MLNVWLNFCDTGSWRETETEREINLKKSNIIGLLDLCQCCEEFLTLLHEKSWGMKATPRPAMSSAITHKATTHWKQQRRSAGEALGWGMRSSLSLSKWSSTNVCSCPTWCLSIFQIGALHRKGALWLLIIVHVFPHRGKVGIPGLPGSPHKTHNWEQRGEREPLRPRS